jgi:thiol-disulfide isomerase/thioredoxin
MKLRFVLTITMALFVLLCNAQKIDTSALKLLKIAFDKVKSLKEVSYTMVFIDSISYGNKPMRLNKIDTVFINKSHGTKLFLFGNGNAKRVSNDTLFSYIHSPEKSCFTTNWDNHELVKYEIENLLGPTPHFVNASVDSIKFNTNDIRESRKYFVIDIILTKRSFNEGAIKERRRYERIWIDKNTRYPVKRRMLSERIDDMNVEATDVYEFSVSFTTNQKTRQFDVAKFYRTEAIEKDEKITEEDMLMLGTNAPDFSFIDVKTGKSAKLSDFLNKVVLLDFWYLECAPCRYLMPKLERISKKYIDQNVVVLGVNAKDINVSKIETLLQRKGFSYLQYYNPEESVPHIYQLAAFPTTLLLNKKGVIIHKEVGYSEDFEEKIGRLIDKELK